MKVHLLLLACLAVPTTLHAATPDKRPAVILVPGYLGSFLRDVNTKKRFYVTVESALGRPGTLSLFQKELGTPAGPALEVDGVMDYVPAVITKIDVYGSMIESLGKMPGVQVIPFAYDWRQDPYEWIKKFGDLIAQLKANGVPTIDVVAHSAGGWLTTYYMAYGTQAPANAVADWSGAKNLRKIVLLGTPFQGGWPLFRELSKGSTLPTMNHLLPADTMASFPSIYCATPLGDGHMLDHNGQPLRGQALSQIETWKANHLGLLSRTDLPASLLTARVNFLSEKLQRCQRFMSLLQLDNAKAPANISVLSVVGTGHKTMDKSFLIEDRGQPRVIFDSDYPRDFGLDDAKMFADGDGTVPAASSALPLAFSQNSRKLTTAATHEKLTTDPAIQVQVVDFLRK